MIVSSRRRVLWWLGLSLVTLAGVAWGRRRTFAPWLLSAALDDERPRPLRGSTVQCLRAAVVALLDARVEPEHYVEFFHWRAEHLPGVAAMYERFAVSMDRAARARGAHGFASAPRMVQRAILDRLRVPTPLERARRIAFDRDAARFSRHVVRQVFRRFAATDAWVLAGYAAWPGMPRAVARLRPAEPRP